MGDNIERDEMYGQGRTMKKMDSQMTGVMYLFAIAFVLVVLAVLYYGLVAVHILPPILK